MKHVNGPVLVRGEDRIGVPENYGFLEMLAAAEQ
jgi:hypothetical protein